MDLYTTCMSLKNYNIFLTLILPAKNIYHQFSDDRKSYSTKGVYISVLTMPEKLPRRSTFLPSLSIKIVAINDPKVV